jgi:hypothetical protein
MKFCFIFKGKKICIFIPILIRPWIPPWGLPDPPPYKWLDATDISEKLQKEILTLGLINELTKSLSADRARRLQVALKEMNFEKDLPEGTSISF